MDGGIIDGRLRVVVARSRHRNHEMRQIPLLFLLVSSAAAQDAANALPDQVFRVPLKTATATMQSMGVGIAIQADAAGLLKAIIPGGLEARVQRTPAPLEGMIVEIPDAQPASLVLLNHQESVVTLKRAVGSLKSAQYLLSYGRTELNGQTHEDFFWRPAYRAQGKLKLPGCEIGAMVLDLNGDGVFDREDSRSATTIGLDVNNDGIFYGAAEYRKLEEIIDVCGVPLQATDLDPAGLSITSRVSAVTVPVINAPIPTFAVTTEKGQLIRSSDFRG